MIERARDPGAARGFAAPFRGIWILLRRPSLWPLAAVPMVLFGGIAAAGSVVGRVVWRRLDAMMLRSLGHSLLARVGLGIGEMIVALLLLCAVVIVAALLVPPLAAPFMDALAARVDRRKLPEEPLARQIVRSIRVALAGLLLLGLPSVVLWILALAFPALAPMWAGMGVAWASFGVAFDALDWPLSRRGLGVRARLNWMRERPRLSGGLGFAVWALSMVPGLSVFALPAIVAGAVEAVNDAEGV